MGRFTFVTYDEKSLTLNQSFKELFEKAETAIGDLNDGRSTSMALTKLEETHMWVGKAIRDSQIARSNPSTMPGEAL